MFQTSEVINVALIVLLAPLVLTTVRGVPVPQRRTFTVALLAMLSGYVFTVLEGLGAGELFNLVEHVSYALAGVMFSVGLLRAGRSQRRGA